MLALVLAFLALAVACLALFTADYRQSIEPRFELLIAREIARQLDARNRIRRVEPVKQDAVKVRKCSKGCGLEFGPHRGGQEEHERSCIPMRDDVDLGSVLKTLKGAS